MLHSPAIIAHRGGRKWAPENTLAAFKKCLEIGVDGVELDVQRCKSGELMVIHDETLDRTTNGAGYVKDQTCAEIQKLDAGGWFSAEFKGEKVPTLREVLDLVHGRFIVNIEIKNAPIAYLGIEEEVIRVLENYPNPEKIIISCFDHAVLHAINTKTTKYKLGILMVGTPYELGHYAELLGAKAWHPNISELRPDAVNEAHRAGLEVNTWTLNEVKDWQRAADMGVNGIVTDDPLGLMEYLRLRSTASTF